jgi:hypothetical protein
MLDAVVGRRLVVLYVAAEFRCDTKESTSETTNDEMNEKRVYYSRLDDSRLQDQRWAV